MGSGITDNQILFDCEEEILKGVPPWISNNDDVCSKVGLYIRDYKENKGKEINNNFSHDNWKGVACWLKEYYPCFLKEVPILGRHSWRPDNFALFFYIRYPVAGLSIIWIYVLFQLIDAIRMRKDAEGIPHTSGLLLNFFVLQSFGFNLTFKFVSWRVEKTFQGGWHGVFKRYFVQENNIKVLRAFEEKYGI